MFINTVMLLSNNGCSLQISLPYKEIIMPLTTNAKRCKWSNVVIFFYTHSIFLEIIMPLTTSAKARKTRQLRITDDDLILFSQFTANFQTVLSLQICLLVDTEQFISEGSPVQTYRVFLLALCENNFQMCLRYQGGKMSICGATWGCFA